MESYFEVIITYAGDKFLGLLNQKLTSHNLDKLPLIYNNGVNYRGKIHLDIAQDIGRDFSIEYLFSDELEDICEYFFGKYDEEKKAKYIFEIGLKRLIGVIELSNMCNSKPDLVSRTTPGMLNTFVHYETAYNEDYVIPDKKKIIESIKTLKELMELDKSGMIYYPEPGVYFNVAKLDFASMYPNIIVKNNISAETVFCHHGCGDICKLKKGIVPKGLRKILERRLMLKKQMIKSEGEKREVIDIKQRSLKTLLVTCFRLHGLQCFHFLQSRVQRTDKQNFPRYDGRDEVDCRKTPNASDFRICRLSLCSGRTGKNKEVHRGDKQDLWNRPEHRQLLQSDSFLFSKEFKV